MNTLLTALVVAMVLLAALDFAAQRAVPARVEQLFSEGRHEELLACADTWVARHTLSPYALGCARVGALAALGRDEEAWGALDHLSHMSLSTEQRADLLERRLSLAVSRGQRKRAEQALREVREFGDEALESRCTMLYDIELEGSSAYIGLMEEALPEASGPFRAQLLYLLAAQHDNAGDAEAAERCREAIAGASL